MTRIDLAAVVLAGIAAAKKLKHVENVGSTGSTGSKIDNALKINGLKDRQAGTHEFSAEVPQVPSVKDADPVGTYGTHGFLLRVPDDDGGNTLEKQQLSDTGTCGTTGTRNFNDTFATPLRRRPWEIDPAGERQEQDAKYFRELLRRSRERAGLPTPETPPIDAMTALLEAWRHEDEEAYRCWARHLPDDPS
jgi:hypothetical protein